MNARLAKTTQFIFFRLRPNEHFAAYNLIVTNLSTHDSRAWVVWLKLVLGLSNPHMQFADWVAVRCVRSNIYSAVKITRRF